MKLLPKSNVEVFADEKAFNVLKDAYPKPLLNKATEESFGTEFLSHKMSVLFRGALQLLVPGYFQFFQLRANSFQRRDGIYYELLLPESLLIYPDLNPRVNIGTVFLVSQE